MLWYKAWLETRWLLLAALLCALLVPAGVHFRSDHAPGHLWSACCVGLPIVTCFLALLLAGSGTTSERAYGLRAVFHSSMQFTMSLPIARMRLLFVRVLTGATEYALATAAAVIALGYWWPDSPAAFPFWAAAFFARLLLCTGCVYALAVLVACLFQENRRNGITSGIIGAAAGIQATLPALKPWNPLSAMFPGAPLTWAPVAVSLLLTTLFLTAAVLIVRRQEF